MKISIVFVYPLNSGLKYHNYALRFIQSYYNHPANIDHETIVVLNQGKASLELECLFSPFPNLRFIEHDNSGYDIGSFQKASQQCNSDMIVFFGTSSYINVDGWLERMAGAFMRHGNAQYGAMGNRGNLGVGVWPHIRTTAFWMSPALFNAYPTRVTRPEQRHPFEHGKDCFTAWVTKQGLKSWVVTTRADYEQMNWNDDPNGYAKGNQSAMLAGDRMCERPYFKNQNKCIRDLRDCTPWVAEDCWACMTH